MTLYLSPLRGSRFLVTCFLGLTPQAMDMSLLRSLRRWDFHEMGGHCPCLRESSGFGPRQSRSWRKRRFEGSGLAFGQPWSGERCIAWGVSPRGKSITIPTSPRRGRNMVSLFPSGNSGGDGAVPDAKTSDFRARSRRSRICAEAYSSDPNTAQPRSGGRFSGWGVNPPAAAIRGRGRGSPAVGPLAGDGVSRRPKAVSNPSVWM